MNGAHGNCGYASDVHAHTQRATACGRPSLQTIATLKCRNAALKTAASNKLYKYSISRAVGAMLS